MNVALITNQRAFYWHERHSASFRYAATRLAPKREQPLSSPSPQIVEAVVVPSAALPHPPRWLSAAQLRPAPAALLRDWLFNQESLTRRLTALSDQRFSVQPLQQGWQTLRDDECAALQIPAHSIGWVREVFLLGAGQPWVFARSVAGRQALEDSAFDLGELGSRSLGELLFSDHAFSRGELQVCRYPAAWLPNEARAEQLWARRSCFRRDSLAVLVAEVFLPTFWEQAL